MINRYIDALAREGEWGALDRVITAQSWCAGGLSDGGESRCLKGWAQDITYPQPCGPFDAAPFLVRAHYPYGLVEGWEADLRMSAAAPRHRQRSLTVPARFNRLVARFGMERTVRAIKQRCARHTRISLPASSNYQVAEKV